MVLNLFRAVTHFKGPPILVAHFHRSYDYNGTSMSVRYYDSEVDLQKK